MAGILYVTIHPDPSLQPLLPLFHDWYNNEHGPLRLRIPHVFLNGARLRAADGQHPHYLAVYDVTDVYHLNSDIYTSLRENRSPREARIVSHLRIERFFYRLLHAVHAPQQQHHHNHHHHQRSEPITLDDLPDSEALGSTFVAVEITLKEGRFEGAGAAAALETWFAHFVAPLSASTQWLRSRLFKLSSDGDDPAAPRRFLILHEFLRGSDDPDHHHHPSHLRAIIPNDPHAIATHTTRTWSLFYRFGPSSSDLESLSLLTPNDSFTSPDGRTITHPGPDPIIQSYITTTTTPFLTIPYRLEGNPSPAAPVIAFSNSLLTSLHMWDPLIAILKKSRPHLRFLRYDTRGRHPLPDHPGPNPAQNQKHPAADLALVTSDLRSLLDALRIPRLHALIGVSMGGLTALNFALTHPDRLHRFVACDFNCSSSPANTQAWKDRIALAEKADAHAGISGIRTLAEQTTARWFHPDASRKTPEAVRLMTDMVSQNSVQGFKNSCTVLWDYDLRPDLHSCATPGLLVAGSHDGNGALVGAMESFKGLIGESGTELRIVPGTGHLPMYEDPEAFWQTIEDFV